VCSIQVHPQLASNWRGLKWPGQREVALVEEVGRGGRRKDRGWRDRTAYFQAIGPIQ
jgi:hypothetical protein